MSTYKVIFLKGSSKSLLQHCLRFVVVIREPSNDRHQLTFFGYCFEFQEKKPRNSVSSFVRNFSMVIIIPSFQYWNKIKFMLLCIAKYSYPWHWNFHCKRAIKTDYKKKGNLIWFKIRIQYIKMIDYNIILTKWNS